MQHELTHQILGEFGRRGGGYAWISEGAATFLENAKMENGALTLGGIKGNRRAFDYRRRGTARGSLRRTYPALRAWPWA